MDDTTRIVNAIQKGVPEGFIGRASVVIGDYTYTGLSKPGTLDTSLEWYIIRTDNTTGEELARVAIGSWSNKLNLKYL